MSVSLVGVLRLRAEARGTGALKPVGSVDPQVRHAAESGIVAGVIDALESDLAHYVRNVVHTPVIETRAGVTAFELVHDAGRENVRIGENHAAAGIVIAGAAVAVQKRARIGVLIVDGQSDTGKEVVAVRELVIDAGGDVVGVELQRPGRCSSY